MKTILTIMFMVAAVSAPFATAQITPQASHVETAVSSGEFTKKRYSVHGSWEIVTIDGNKALKFSDDFKTKNGPDLKVFLSPKPLDTLGKKVSVSNSVNIGVLKSNKGAQIYKLPEGVSLSDYESVLIHCEAYSVLWGGFDIPK